MAQRVGAVTVATRLPVALAARAGAAPAAPVPPAAWGDTVVLVPRRPMVDALTGRRHDGGAIPLAELLATYPVALLVPDDDAPATGAAR